MTVAQVIFLLAHLLLQQVWPSIAKPLPRIRAARRVLEGDEPPIKHRRVAIECSVDSGVVNPQNVDRVKAQQDDILAQVMEAFPLNEVTLVSRQWRLLNVMFIEMQTTDDDDDDAMDDQIRDMEGVKGVSLSVDLDISSATLQPASGGANGRPQVADVAGTYLGAKKARDDQCLTGKGIRVAILDSGIDYTHQMFGGDGTFAAYQRAASSTRPRADGLFPTSRVVAGRDFVPESGVSFGADTNPLDQRSGHGTMVASAVLAMAPEAELIAAKVCNRAGSCPDYAVMDALDYAYEQGADVINISLGQPYTNGFYNMLARVIDDATKLGMSIVLPSGNYGNSPFIMGGIADVANVITVGATSTNPYGKMTSFSARGPGILNDIKPDISAPGDTMTFADAGSGDGGKSARGTSFASPLVAGAAALIRQKCENCSSFAIKSILMNNAKRTIKDNRDANKIAPISWVGSGEADMKRAVDAAFWAFSIEDKQPKISMGVVDVNADMVLKRNILVSNISKKRQRVKVTSMFRHDGDKQLRAMEVGLNKETISLSANCQSTRIIEVQFKITASNVPYNHMTSGGVDGKDPTKLDKNEFDGWIILTAENGEVEVSIPFHSILRRAADVTVGGVTRLSTPRRFPPVANIQLTNRGAGIAHVEAYELLATSADDSEPNEQTYSLSPPADFRFIGYRTIPQDSCGHLIEFAFQLWERQQTLANIELKVLIDTDGDQNHDFVLSNRGPRYNQETASECRIQQADGTWDCAHYPPDHPTNSASIVLRACSDDLGIRRFSSIGVQFSSSTFPRISQQIDNSPYVTVAIPSVVSAASTNIHPNATLSSFRIHPGPNKVRSDSAQGLLLLTNAYRDESNTGAASAESEAIAIPFSNIVLPTERTPDNPAFPRTLSMVGPTCNWGEKAPTCAKTRSLKHLYVVDNGNSNNSEEGANRALAADTCQDNRAKRDYDDILPPTTAPSANPTLSPTNAPSSHPTLSPIAKIESNDNEVEDRGAGAFGSLIDSDFPVDPRTSNSFHCSTSFMSIFLSGSVLVILLIGY